MGGDCWNRSMASWPPKWHSSVQWTARFLKVSRMAAWMLGSSSTSATRMFWACGGVRVGPGVFAGTVFSAARFCAGPVSNRIGSVNDPPLFFGTLIIASSATFKNCLPSIHENRRHWQPKNRKFSTRPIPFLYHLFSRKMSFNGCRARLNVINRTGSLRDNNGYEKQRCHEKRQAADLTPKKWTGQNGVALQ